MRTVYVPIGISAPCVELNAICAAGGTCGGLRAHRPVDVIDAAADAGGNRVDHLAVVADHFDGELAEQMARLLVVDDVGAVARIRTGERCIAFAPAAERGDALLDRFARQEGRFGVQHFRIERAQRREVVDDPDAASVRGEHHRRIAFLEIEIAHGDGREIVALELRPGSRRRRSTPTDRTRCRRTACSAFRCLP